MIIPIWVASWEIECCQPEAVVGQGWAAPFLKLLPPEPWWREYASGQITAEIEALGVVDLDGEVVRESTDDAPAVFRSGAVRVVVRGPLDPDATHVRGRLLFEGHDGPGVGPGVSHDKLECRGIARRVRGIPLLYELRDGTHVPVAQDEPVDLTSTADRRFPEYLIELEVPAPG
ncbi:MAG: hypothetical protein ACRD12_20670 [Acidimicrobiales bacterium]